MTDELIASERLELPLLSLEQMDAIAEGDATAVANELRAAFGSEWVDEVRWLAGFRATQLRERPQDRPWLIRPIIRNESGQPREAIGYLNFHMAPDEHGMAEIGYTLLPAARGKGYALEAVRAAIAWATREHGVQCFRASVAPDNERSLNLIGKLGFVKKGEQWDETDGLEWVYELEV
ncbi:MAG TPA: GNAT family N-acetyltransferase [Candidatus Limnocylindria bacterium]|nr:GNAT family N-acetyltransferase [Candidatus Limnocylindria bacterium]